MDQTRIFDGKSFTAARGTYNNGNGTNEVMCEKIRSKYKARGCKTRRIAVKQKRSKDKIQIGQNYILYVEDEKRISYIRESK